MCSGVRSTSTAVKCGAVAAVGGFVGTAYAVCSYADEWTGAADDVDIVASQTQEHEDEDDLEEVSVEQEGAEMPAELAIPLGMFGGWVLLCRGVSGLITGEWQEWFG